MSRQSGVVQGLPFFKVICYFILQCKNMSLVHLGIFLVTLKFYSKVFGPHYLQPYDRLGLYMVLYMVSAGHGHRLRIFSFFVMFLMDSFHFFGIGLKNAIKNFRQATLSRNRSDYFCHTCIGMGDLGVQVSVCSFICPCT